MRRNLHPHRPELHLPPEFAAATPWQAGMGPDPRVEGRWDGHRGGMSIQNGTTVRWSWSGSTATGTVREIHRVTRTLQGSEVTRNGSAADPAYVIEQDDGSRVLKLRSEVERA